MQDLQDEIYMLWLSYMVGKIDSRKLNLILDVFGTAHAAFSASGAELARAASLSSRCVNLLCANRDLGGIQKLREDLLSRGIQYFSKNHKKYPALLKEIPDPPIGIFCVGQLPADTCYKIAIIGARKCSEYGLLTARTFAKPLAEANVVVVSGMARGIDSMAHRGAIMGGGKTIAVLGCGVDVCYPPENKDLRADIINSGCIISEYPPETTPFPAFFPARNRIISGLSHGVIVVEAGKKSGTLITVDQALDQGREVFAVPGTISSKLSEGTNQLIKDGATFASSYKDILDALGIDLEQAAKEKKEQKSNIFLALDEKQVYDVLDFNPLSIDELVKKTGLALGRLILLCTQLETKGFIRKLQGSRYVRS
ncbi:MAG: DNA-processing protein DprA [Defluviitaleaceae bacterium]|nr:DNA-processing protein DprA [Defluviitaleaceae bacterium]